MSGSQKREGKVLLPIKLDELACDSCVVGCSGEFHPIEFCPFITREFPTGAVLGERGDETQYLWFIKSGAVAGTFGPGRETHIVHPAGSFVGLEALLVDKQLMTSWTLARTTVCGITRDAFKQWLERRSALEAQLQTAAAEIVATEKVHHDKE